MPRICKAVSPDELFALVQRDDAAHLVKRGIDEERAKKVVAHLRSSEAIYAIQTVELEDEPYIKLLHGTYKRAGKLSSGQKGSAILSIILVESDRPLVIDQPEDSLANSFIAQIAEALRVAQTQRQIILVTHNPNIPVLGHAQRVFALESDGHTARLAAHGTVDEMRAWIEKILEGGREAFARRKEIYGY